jgi:hypothetical protein
VRAIPVLPLWAFVACSKVNLLNNNNNNNKIPSKTAFSVYRLAIPEYSHAFSKLVSVFGFKVKRGQLLKSYVT